MTEPAGFEECAGVIRAGARCVLGHRAGGGYAVWLVRGGYPAEQFGGDEVGWRAACRQFDEWERLPRLRPVHAVGASGVLFSLVWAIWWLVPHH